eukprot:Phypoly_transcript_25421.p1 GENE.Phypoly_transcript_25421~~Phypoly_transcript_25421.p1  ORF type:complete len:103 (+),score=12.88 Phypoly_transcript_25421:96-404(+)
MVALEERPEVLRKLKILQREKDRENNDTTVLWGYVLLICTFIFFVGTIYAMVVSKFMPHTGNKILDFIKEDYYYCMLVPATIPVTVIAVYLNWLSLKFFRHN